VAVRLIYKLISFYNGLKVSCFPSLGTCFQQVYHQRLEGGEGLGTGLGHRGESPWCATSQGCPSSARWISTAFTNPFYRGGGLPGPLEAAVADLPVLFLAVSWESLAPSSPVALCPCTALPVQEPRNPPKREQGAATLMPSAP